MSKTMCQKGKKGQQDTPDPKYICKKCGAKVKKEKQVCKPEKLKKE
ncbi:MAG: hypothetical protein WCQ70_11625 [Lentimicrobiaceae bacterium]